jgi:lipopolysaccharide export system protein LptA
MLAAGTQSATAQQADSTAADTTQQTRAYVQADSLSATVVDGERVQELIGNVFVRQDSTELRSEQAFRYLDRDEFLFLRAVEIVEGPDTLHADTVRYERGNELGFAFGNVELTDGEVDVRSTEAIYFVDERRTVFEKPVELQDSTAVLRSDRGTYRSPERRADFAGNVTLDDPDSWLEADSLSYYRDRRRSEAFGNVFIDRTPRQTPNEDGDSVVAEDERRTRTWLFGMQAINDEEERRSDVQGNALMMQVRMDSLGAPRDTLMVRAERLLGQRSDSLRRLTAIDSVEVWQDDLAATADSLVYDRAIAPDTASTPPYEESRLYRRPNAWFETTQVYGDSLRTVVRNRSLDTLYVTGGAFAAQQDTVLQRINQLRGGNLTAAFREDQLRSIRAAPTAETIRFVAEDGALSEAARGSGDAIIIAFDTTQTLRRVRIIQGTQSMLYEPHLIPNPFELDGFRWTPEVRPRADVLLQDPRVQRRMETGWSFDTPERPTTPRRFPSNPPDREPPDRNPPDEDPSNEDSSDLL